MPSLCVLDVGHGNCAVLRDSKGIIVIDAGGPGPFLLEHLNDSGTKEISILLLSHADEDHIGGALALLSDLKVRIDEVYLNPDAAKKTAIWDDLLYVLYDRHKRGKISFEISLTTALTGKLDRGDVRLEVLAPNQYIVGKGSGSKDRKGRKLTSNSISAVFRLTFQGIPFAMLSGDIDATALDNLLEDFADIRSWLSVFPHHGGRPGSSKVEEFIARYCKVVAPEKIVFSVGTNTNHFPTQVVVDTIAGCLENVSMYTTQSSGVLKEYIKRFEKCTHMDAVGNVFVEFDAKSPRLRFD